MKIFTTYPHMNIYATHASTKCAYAHVQTKPLCYCTFLQLPTWGLFRDDFTEPGNLFFFFDIEVLFLAMPNIRVSRLFLKGGKMVTISCSAPVVLAQAKIPLTVLGLLSMLGLQQEADNKTSTFPVTIRSSLGLETPNFFFNFYNPFLIN